MSLGKTLAVRLLDGIRLNTRTLALLIQVYYKGTGDRRPYQRLACDGENERHRFLKGTTFGSWMSRAKLIPVAFVRRRVKLPWETGDAICRRGGKTETI